MDFALPPEIDDYRIRIRAFVREHVIPLEAHQGNYDEHDNIRHDLLENLRAEAKAAVCGHFRCLGILAAKA